MSEKSIAQKLFLRSGQAAAIIHPPEGYLASLGELPAGLSLSTNADQPLDFIQVFVGSRKELEDQLPRLKNTLKPGGSIWVTYTKGTSKVKTDINRDSINAYAHTLGLEGVAMISIDNDWSGLRLKLIK